MEPAIKLAAIFIVTLSVSACGTIDRLANVGKPPPFDNAPPPQEVAPPRAAIVPVAVETQEMKSSNANSLWRDGARGFFKDQRARNIGDLLTVSVTIADQADLSNETNRSRNNSDSLDLTNVLGLQNYITKIFSDAGDPSSLVSAGSRLSNAGAGDVSRSESVDFAIAARVTDKLPNGNLIIYGRQQVRVNHELRDILVSGIVRPEDVSPTNQIPHDKIAELRVSYGGKGYISDVQQSRYGAQVLDILLPY